MDDADHDEGEQPRNGNTGDGEHLQGLDAASVLARYAKMITSQSHRTTNKFARTTSNPRAQRKNTANPNTADASDQELVRWNAPGNINTVGRKLIKVLFPAVAKSISDNKRPKNETDDHTAAEITAEYLTSDVRNALIVLLALVDDPNCTLPSKFDSIGRLCGRLLIEVAEEISRFRTNNRGNSSDKFAPVSDDLLPLYQVCQAFYNRLMRSAHAADSDAESDTETSSNKTSLHGSSVALDFIPPMLVYLMRFGVPKFADSDCRAVDPLLRYVEHGEFYLRRTEGDKIDAQLARRVQNEEESDDSSLDDLEEYSSQQSKAPDDYLHAFDRKSVQVVVTSIRIFMVRVVALVEEKYLDKALARLARIMTANDEICDFCHTTIKMTLCQSMSKAQEARVCRAFGLLYKLSWMAMRKRVKDSDDGLVALMLRTDNSDLKETVQHLENNIMEIIGMSVKLSDQTNMLMRVQALVRSWREVFGSRTNLAWSSWLFDGLRQHLAAQNISPDERIRRNLLWLFALFFPLVDPTWTEGKKKNEFEGQLKMIRDLLFDPVADVRHDAVATCTAILQHSWQVCPISASRGIVSDIAQLCYDQNNLKVKLRAIDFFVELVKKHETHVVLKKALTALKPLINDPNLRVVNKLLQLYEQIFVAEQRYKNTVTTPEQEQQLVRLKDACDLPVLMSIFNSKSLLENRRRKRASAEDPNGDAHVAETVRVNVAVILRKYIIPKPTTGTELFTNNEQITKYKSNLRRRCLQLKNVDRSQVLTCYQTFAKLASNVELLDRYTGALFDADAVAADNAIQQNGDDVAGSSNDGDEGDAESSDAAKPRRGRKGGQKAAAAAKQQAKKAVPFAGAVSKRNKSLRGRKTKKATKNEQQIAAGSGGDDDDEAAKEKEKTDAENARLRRPRDELLLVISALLSGLKYFFDALDELSQDVDENSQSNSDVNFEQQLNEKIMHLFETDDNNLRDEEAEEDTMPAPDRRGEFAKTMDEALYLIEVAGIMWDAAVFIGLNSELSDEGRAERIRIMQKFLRCAKSMLSWSAMWQSNAKSGENSSARAKFLPHALLVPQLVPRGAVLDSRSGLPLQIESVIEHLHEQMLFERRHVAQFICRVLWRIEKYRDKVVDFIFDCVCTTSNNDENSAVLPLVEKDLTSSPTKRGGRRKKAAPTPPRQASSSAAQPHSRRLPSSVPDADRRAEAPLVGVLILHGFLLVDCIERSAIFNLLGDERLQQLHKQLLLRLKASVAGHQNVPGAGVADDVFELVNKQKSANDLAQIEKRNASKRGKEGENEQSRIPIEKEQTAVYHVKLLADLVGGFTGPVEGLLQANPRLNRQRSPRASTDSEGEVGDVYNLEEIERNLISDSGWPDLVESLVGLSSAPAEPGSIAFRQLVVNSLKDLSAPTMVNSTAAVLPSDGRNQNNKKNAVRKPRKPAAVAAAKKPGTSRTTRNSSNNGLPVAQEASTADPVERRSKRPRRAATKPDDAASEVVPPAVDERAVEVNAVGNEKVDDEATNHADDVEKNFRRRVVAVLIKSTCEMADRTADNVELNAGFFNGLSTLLYLFDDLDVHSSAILHNATILASLVTNMTHQALCLASFVDSERERQRANVPVDADPLVTPPRRPPTPPTPIGESTICNEESKIGPLVQHSAKLLARLLFSTQFIDARWLQGADNNDAERKRFASSCLQAQKAVDITFKRWCNAWTRENDDSHRLMVLRELESLLTKPLQARLLCQAVVGDDIGKRVASFFARSAVDWPEDKKDVMEIVGRIGDALVRKVESGVAEPHSKATEAPQESADGVAVDDKKQDARFAWIKQFSSCMILYLKMLATPHNVT